MKNTQIDEAYNNHTPWDSARAKDSDIYEYLKYLLMEQPNNGYLEHPEITDGLTVRQPSPETPLF